MNTADAMYADGNYDIAETYYRKVLEINPNDPHAKKQFTELNIVSPEYQDKLYLIENETGEYGFIDKTGKEVIPCIYSDAKSFYDGAAMVVSNSKRKYIDKQGNEYATKREAVIAINLNK